MVLQRSRLIAVIGRIASYSQALPRYGSISIRSICSGVINRWHIVRGQRWPRFRKSRCRIPPDPRPACCVENDAGHEIDLDLIQKLLDDLLGDLGFLLVFDDDRFGGQTAQIAVELYDRQSEAVTNIDTETGAWFGEADRKPTFTDVRLASSA